MARRTFFSFHYEPDCWRAAQIRNMGAVEGNTPVSDNDWEEVKKGGDTAIEKWIAEQLKGRSCTIVLVGANTASRKWVKYEIKESWNGMKGIVGIHIHNLLDRDKKQSQKGSNPFDSFTVGDKKLSSIVKLYDPPYTTSTDVYDYIKQNLAGWVDEAIEIRNNN